MIRDATIPALLGALALALTVTACGGDSGGELECNGGGDDNKLEGSYCEDVTMRFTEVRVARQQQFVFIEYVRPIGEGEDLAGLEKTLSILFDASTVQITEEEPISFLEHSGTVRRILNEGSQNLTPELEPSSQVTFETYTEEIGGDVRGKFALLFDNGRTLSGDFSTTLTERTAEGQ